MGAMRRAADVFTFERRPAQSALVEQVWQTRSAPDDCFISVAVTHWEMVVTRREATTWLTVRGGGQRLFSDGLQAKFTLSASETYDNSTLHLAYLPAA